MPCLISLIVPVYNTAPYLADCLKSILAAVQGKSERIQVILIDDGSTDGSGRICEEYAARHSFLQVRRQQNAGVASARNAGLALAAGEYIAWVDSDDLIAPNWFHRLEAVLDRYAPDVVLFDSLLLSENRQQPEVYGRPAGFVEKNLFLSDLARDLRLKSGLPNKVIRRALFHGLRFPEGEPILEDYAVIFSALLPAERFYYLPEPLYHYRQQAASLLHSHSPERTFRGIQIAIARKNALPAHLQSAAEIGVAVQMLWFCRARAYDRRYLEKKDAYAFCTAYLRRSLPIVFRDREVHLSQKCKILAAALGILPHLVTLKENT